MQTAAALASQSIVNFLESFFSLKKHTWYLFKASLYLSVTRVEKAIPSLKPNLLDLVTSILWEFDGVLTITFEYIVSCNYFCTWVNFVLRFIRGHVGVCNCYEGNFLHVAQCICCLIASCSSVCHFVFEAQKQYDKWQKLASFATVSVAIVIFKPSILSHTIC